MFFTLFSRAIVLLALLFAPAAHAQTTPGTETWTPLGQFTIPAGAATFRMAIKPDAGRYNGARLIATSGSIDIERIVIGYTNGSVHYEDRAFTLAPPDRTLRLDVRPEQRAIEFIEVVTKAGAAPRQPVVVEVGGLRIAPPAAPVRSPMVVGVSSAPAPAPASQPPRAPVQERSATPSTPRALPGPVATAPAPGGYASPSPAPRMPAASPSPPASTAPTGGVPATTPAKADAAYTAVPVFFGTDRKREADRSKWGRNLAAFSGVGAPTATWGRAVISVPKAGRAKGDISRPEWDLFFTSISLRAEDLARDFVLMNVDVLDRASFLTAVKEHAKTGVAFKDQAFVFVHGYRVSFDDALFRAAQIAHDMGFDGLPFVYSWPSSAGVVGYLYDERQALGAREPLRAFLDMVVKESGAKKVHLIAHSMGAQALLEVLRDIHNIAGPATAGTKPIFNEVILAAPDVTRENFQQMADRIRGLSTGMTLYASANDRALRLSAKLSGASAGHVPSTGPMVVPGVDSIDVSAASTDFFSLNHSAFADRSSLLDDMRQILERSVRPPDVRAKVYVPVKSPTGTYWKFEKRE